MTSKTNHLNYNPSLNELSDNESLDNDQHDNDDHHFQDDQPELTTSDTLAYMDPNNESLDNPSLYKINNKDVSTMSTLEISYDITQLESDKEIGEYLQLLPSLKDLLDSIMLKETQDDDMEVAFNPETHYAKPLFIVDSNVISLYKCFHCNQLNNNIYCHVIRGCQIYYCHECIESLGVISYEQANEHNHTDPTCKKCNEKLYLDNLFATDSTIENMIAEYKGTCSKCGNQVERKQWHSHVYHQCPIQCDNIGCYSNNPKNFTLSNIKQHDDRCPYKRIRCASWSLGCRVQMERAKLDNHTCKYQEWSEFYKLWNKNDRGTKLLLIHMFKLIYEIKMQLRKRQFLCKDMETLSLSCQSMNDSQQGITEDRQVLAVTESSSVNTNDTENDMNESTLRNSVYTEMIITTLDRMDKETASNLEYIKLDVKSLVNKFELLLDNSIFKNETNGCLLDRSQFDMLLSSFDLIHDDQTVIKNKFDAIEGLVEKKLGTISTTLPSIIEETLNKMTPNRQGYLNPLSETGSFYKTNDDYLCINKQDWHLFNDKLMDCFLDQNKEIEIIHDQLNHVKRLVQSTYDNRSMTDVYNHSVSSDDLNSKLINQVTLLEQQNNALLLEQDRLHSKLDTILSSIDQLTCQVKQSQISEMNNSLTQRDTWTQHAQDDTQSYAKQYLFKPTLLKKKGMYKQEEKITKEYDHDHDHQLKQNDIILNRTQDTFKFERIAYPFYHHIIQKKELEMIDQCPLDHFQNDPKSFLICHYVTNETIADEFQLEWSYLCNKCMEEWKVDKGVELNNLFNSNKYQLSVNSNYDYMVYHLFD